MMLKLARVRVEGHYRVLVRAISAIWLLALVGNPAAAGQDSPFGEHRHFRPGNLVVSRSVYDNTPNNVKAGTILPPNCADTQAGCAAPSGAPYDGSYPFVWNNDVYDKQFRHYVEDCS